MHLCCFNFQRRLVKNETQIAQIEQIHTENHCFFDRPKTIQVCTIMPRHCRRIVELDPPSPRRRISNFPDPASPLVQC